MKFLLIMLFAVGSVFGQGKTIDSIDYEIRPIPKADRTDLDVSVSFKSKDVKPLTIKLPIGCYGTPNIHQYVRSFTGLNGTKITKTEKDNERIIEPDKKGRVSFKYYLSYDPEKMDDSAFSPNTGANYFSIAGCQWLLRIGDNDEKRDVSIKIVGAPKDWKFHSSIRKNAKGLKLKASFSDLVPARIGGGGDSRTFYIKNKPVSVFIKGNFDIPKEGIFSAVEQIVRIQRDWFADYDQPFFHIVINERPGVIAGTAVENQFVCFIRAGVAKNDLNLLLAHELFHNWLPVKMSIKREKEDHQVRHEWFFEGFTDYFAKKILFDAGLLTPEEFAREINQDIHSLADNPYKAILYKDLLELARARGFTSTHKKLSYFRGVMIALKWERELRQAKEEKSLSDFIRRLFKFTSARKGPISETEFFKFAADYGIDAKTDFENYILKGQPIEIKADALGKDFIGAARDLSSFEIGFSLSETRSQKKITGVTKNSAADRAGLRNGMEYVRVENSGRFSNSWSAEKPLTVIVKINGSEKVFEYFPHGQTIRILQFRVKGNN